MNRRTNQGGSVASFVVIGVILVAGLASAVYFLNLRGQQARKDQTITATGSNQAPKTNTKTNTTTTTQSSTKTSTTKTSSTSTGSKSSNLPATGVETPIINLISIFLLSASTVAFMMSRQDPENSL
jgi:cytoskeletal protein RodZ